MQQIDHPLGRDTQRQRPLHQRLAHRNHAIGEGMEELLAEGLHRVHKRADLAAALCSRAAATVPVRPVEDHRHAAAPFHPQRRERNHRPRFKPVDDVIVAAIEMRHPPRRVPQIPAGARLPGQQVGRLNDGHALGYTGVKIGFVVGRNTDHRHVVAAANQKAGLVIGPKECAAALPGDIVGEIEDSHK